MKHYIIKSLLIMIFFVCASLQATNYYISNSGNDSNNGTSPNSPWKTLDKLHDSWNLVGPGDSILFKRGDMFAPSVVGSRIGLLRIPNTKAGTANAWIVIGAYGSGARPILSGENTSEYHQVIRSGAMKYIVIENLEIRGNILFRPIDDMTMGIQYFKFLGNKMQGNIDKGNSTKISFYNPYRPSKIPYPNEGAPTNNVELGYNEFYDTEGEDCVNIGAAGDSIWVHHNIWKNISEEALDIGGGKGHLIEYNFVSGTTVNGMKFHSQYSHQHDIIVRGNVIVNVGTKTSATALVFQNISNSKIYNNTLWSSYVSYFGNRDRTAPEAYYGDFDGNEIFNNIFAGISQASGSWKDANMGGGYIWYNAPVFNMWSNNSFHHNIFWHPEVSDVVMRFWENPPYPSTSGEVNDSRTVRSGNQTAFNNEWKSKAGSSERMIDPGFVNPYWNDPFNYGNFRVSSSSPAVNAGAVVDGYNVDIDGTPINGTPTIGAYQYNGVDNVPPSISSATALNSTSVRISFNENLKESTAENSSNYSVTNGISVTSASLDGNGRDVTLTVSAMQSGSNYTVAAVNIQDLAGNTIESNNSASFNYTNPDLDTVPPVVASASLESTTSLLVNFNEAVESSSASNTSNYSINNGITVVSAVLSSATQVTLTTSEHTEGQSYSVTVSSVADQAGNAMSNPASVNYTCASSSVSTPSGENLVDNGGFEEGSKSNWGESNTLGGAAYTFAVNSTNPLHGNYEGVINITQAGTSSSRPLIYAGMEQDIEVGKSYVLSFVTKVISGNPKIKYFNAGAGLNLFGGTLSGTQNWEIEIDPATSVTAYVAFYLDGTSTGSFAIDNLTFSEKVEHITLSDLRVFLQGAYVADTMSTSLNAGNVVPLSQPYNDSVYAYTGTESVSSFPSTIVDWVMVELRTGTAANTCVARKAALLDKNGYIKETDGSNDLQFDNLTDGDYYVVIRHRNHLDIMSSSAVTVSGLTGSYDFTTAANKAYGTDSQVQLKSGLYGMYSGDGDANGIVNVVDFSCVSESIFSSGYKCGDYDMNNITNVLDYKKTSLSLFKSIQFPN